MKMPYRTTLLERLAKRRHARVRTARIARFNARRAELGSPRNYTDEQRAELDRLHRSIDVEPESHERVLDRLMLIAQEGGHPGRPEAPGPSSSGPAPW